MNALDCVKTSLKLALATAHQFAYEVFGDRVMRSDKSQLLRKEPSTGRLSVLSFSRFTDKLPGGGNLG
ncbi:hypothetical protein I8H89_02090 [Candidatus Saccharibacteria bacterium]|nr:hypothetical protein [Candidatus Saccharibacteria bacterium]